MKDGAMMGNETAYPDRLIEWLFACMMLIWGGVLLLPFDPFSSLHYAILKAIAPERAWGGFSILVAVGRLAALWINGSWRRTPAVRCLCSILGVVWWLTMIFCILVAEDPYPPPGLFWYGLFVIFEAISCWRSAADGFHSRAFRLRRGLAT